MGINAMKPTIVNDVPAPDVTDDRMDWGFLEELEQGQSAHFDVENYDELIRIRDNLSSAAHRYGRKLDRRFTVRVREDKSGLGVWRVE